MRDKMIALMLCLGVSTVVFANPHVQQRNLTTTLATCNMETSRRVLNFLSTDFIKRMGLKQLDQLPQSCPWSPARSIYGDVEIHKGERRPHDWQVCTHNSFLFRPN